MMEDKNWCIACELNDEAFRTMIVIARRLTPRLARGASRNEYSSFGIIALAMDCLRAFLLQPAKARLPEF
jgi:hypothetical protein